jgi:D-aspartate ligase
VTTSTVAVFDANSMPALAFVRSLAERGVRMTVYSSHFADMARWSRHARECRPCPETDDRDRFLPWLRDEIRAGVIGLVAPTSDLLAYYCAELREEFPDCARRMIPTVECIAVCLDKQKVHECCIAHGVGSLQVESPGSVDEAARAATRIGYPLFIKPRTHIGVGMADRGQVVANEQELRDQFRPYRLAPGYSEEPAAFPGLSLPLLQSFVQDADTLTLCASGFYDAEHGLRALMISERHMAWPPDTGVSVEQVTVANPRVERASLRLLAGLRASGIFNFEMLVRGDEYLVNDVNPRGFGFMSFNQALGHDVAWMWYQAATGVVPDVAVRLPVGRRWIIGLPFYWRLLWALLLGPDRRRALRRWRQALGSSTSTGIFRLDDPLPALFNLVAVLRHPRSFVRHAVRKQLRLRQRERESARYVTSPTGNRGQTAISRK